MSNELATVTPHELSLVQDNTLNGEQLKILLKKTPAKYVHKRPAKGGGTWDYVTGGYVRKMLNLMFGWDWDFEILSERIEFGEVIVKGKLTCRTNGRTIVKMQYGNKDIIFKKAAAGEEKQPLSIGNDLKAAATDALKKCAAEIGIAADIYNKLDFNEVKVDLNIVQLEDLKELFEVKQHSLTPNEFTDIKKAIDQQDTKAYNKFYKLLKSK